MNTFAKRFLLGVPLAGTLLSANAHAGDFSLSFLPDDRRQQTCPFFLDEDTDWSSEDNEYWRHVNADCGAGRVIARYRVKWRQGDFVWAFSLTRESGVIKIKIPINALH
jgi:hypothetical protein